MATDDGDQGAAELPDWADSRMSAGLRAIRGRGEGQDLEYMQSYPENARELGKEIAAFATSNQGTILIGVADGGELLGVADLGMPAQRDLLLARIQGLCRGQIKPSITPTVLFAQEQERTVVAIIVPRGSEPVYYCYGVPYLRHVSESRPAEPHEVVDLVRTRLVVPTRNDEVDPFSELVTRVASNVIEVLMYADQAKQRMVNPWLDEWRRYKFGAIATEMRGIASEDLAVERKIAADLVNLAATLDAVANFRMTVGCGPSLAALVAKAHGSAQAVKERWIDSVPLSDESLVQVRAMVSSTSRQMTNLASRAESMIGDARHSELQAEGAEVGKRLLTLAYYPIDAISPGLAEKLRAIGLPLHLLETRTIYSDGGLSVQEIKRVVLDGESQLKTVVEELER